jgi:hypothetical protein
MSKSEYFDQTMGAVLIATWLNALLYSVECSQVFSYLKVYSGHDPRWLQGVVVLSLIMDTANLVAGFARIYLRVVTHWGGTRSLFRHPLIG